MERSTLCTVDECPRPTKTASIDGTKAMYGPTMRFLESLSPDTSGLSSLFWSRSLGQFAPSTGSSDALWENNSMSRAV
jgi:hypothetical protein